MDVLDMSVDELAGYSFECGCGRTHAAEVGSVLVRRDGVAALLDYLSSNFSGKAMILCDENTYDVAGREIAGKLKDSAVHVINERDGLHVAPNETFVGEVLIECQRDVDFFLAVGSGVVNDITRQVSCKMGKPYVVFATAPSMDGYASVTSSLIVNNVKSTFQGQCPRAIVADIEILRNAPFEMLTAGFGDVIGKYNAIRDWMFGRDFKNEHYCPVIVELVMRAVRKCEDNAASLKARDARAVKYVMDALTLAGMTMGMYGNTRPASGAEHHIVHYWDVDRIKKGMEHPLHGNSVGVGTVVICELFDIVESDLPVPVMQLDAGMIKAKLEEAGGATSPVELGIERDLFRRSVINGHTMAAKFTVLSYLAAEKPDVLERAADWLCEIFYD